MVLHGTNPINVGPYNHSHIIIDSQSDLAMSTQMGLKVIFFIYNRKFWFCMSRDALPDRWTGHSLCL